MTQRDATPDLASVLQALASYGQQGQQTSPAPPQHHHLPGHPRQADPYAAAAGEPRLNGGAYEQAHPQRRKQVPAPAPAAIDPASITEWPLGLRCVTHMASQNASFKPLLRKMIHDQRRHVELWSRGLEEVLGRQGRRRLLPGADAAELAGVNGDAEVRAYASKVHGAATEMHLVMTRELKGLGVPFFGTRPELVDRLGRRGGGGDGLAAGRISEEELVSLQRKMVQYLEDMYG